MKRIITFALIVAMLLCGFAALGEAAPEAPLAIDARPETDYADADNWAYFGVGEDKAADVFLVCPTVDMNDEFNMSLEDADTKASFLGALNMERGIYEDTARLYAPYYRQAAMKVYSLEPSERENWLALAYEDVSAAFAWYLAHENAGRPIILAGFSQGADMCYRLLEEYFGDEALYNQLVAVYAIGWPCTAEMTAQSPQIVPATGEDDLGAVISFDCEAPEVSQTLITPAGVRALAINPLNWKTDGTPADKSENLGACFTRYSGEIKREEAGLCGCYIDESRGALKVTDVDPADYPAIVPGLPEGAYHVYDYQFFFRNLQKNVADRTARFLETRALDDAAAEGDADYVLEQVVVLSRHNLRAPLSSNGSVPDELTPHEWIQWSANSSELTLKGGVEETGMGQYFRKWLDLEGLIPENSVPEEGEVRFVARDKQRCRATARYFAAGLLPLSDITVEYPGDLSGTEDFMKPVLHFYSDAYAEDATAQVAAMGGDAGFEGIAEQTRDVIKLIMDTVDMQDSEVYKSGKYGDLLAKDCGFAMEADKEPDLTGAIKTAYQVADALLLQYYEAPDAVTAAFGHELTDDDWAALGRFMTTCLEMKHGAPLVAVNITNPLLQELEAELKNEGRKFTFFCAHDCTVLGALSALGAKLDALPGSIETKTPIGVKLMFERLRDGEGQVWYRASIVYRSTEQIRSGEMLTPENPPMQYLLSFEGVENNADGLIAEADLLGLFDRSVAALGALEDAYALADAA